jgi:hypothetical protein
MNKTKKILAAVLAFSFLAAFNANACATCDNESSVSSGQVNSIILSGEGANINWAVDGYSPKGFKVVWSKNEHPTYPTREGDKYHYYSNPTKTEDTLTAFDGDGVYYVRVCEYLGGKCGVYSNEIMVTLSGSSEDSSNKNKKKNESVSSQVKSITLRNEGSKVIWTVDGYSSKGFKLVWSKNEHPTYPTRKGDRYKYFSNPNYYYTTLSAFDGDGVYYVRVCEYLGGKCGVYSNEISINLTEDEQIKKIKEKAELLTENKLDSILAELKELRNLVKEQQSEIKYLRSLVNEMNQITDAMQQAINNFITYGVDENTKRLGEGERAAVIYSYKNAFGKLPETEDELADAIKIANGRWPSIKSEVAEEQAQKLFRQIYLRDPNESNIHDNAAIVIMAYGLRQRPENRNLESERQGLKIFKSIFHRLPTSTEDWNVLQAITYSGASR